MKAPWCDWSYWEWRHSQFQTEWLIMFAEVQARKFMEGFNYGYC